MAAEGNGVRRKMGARTLAARVAKTSPLSETYARAIVGETLMAIETGQIVGGKYRLVRQLAAGGMGMVWVARHTELDSEVALKFMLNELSGEPISEARFKREAKAAAQLNSPHVTQIHDYGLHDGAPYIAMELLQGEDLDSLLTRCGSLSPSAINEVISQLCRGLSVAHEAGMVHRDLKPSNVFIASSGEQPLVKILDFGIAKDNGANLVVGATTSVGTLLGSPPYMSPEQAVGDELDHRSDLWSLAVLMYEALTGACLFEANHLGKLIAAICSAPIRPPSEHQPALGADIDAFFERALRREPEERFQSANAMARAFADLIEDGNQRASSSQQRRAMWAELVTSKPSRSNRGRETATASVSASSSVPDDTTVEESGPYSNEAPKDAISDEAATLTNLASSTNTRPPMVSSAALRAVAVVGVLAIGSVGSWLLLRSPGKGPETKPAATLNAPTNAEKNTSLPGSPPTLSATTTATKGEAASSSSSSASHSQPPLAARAANETTRETPRPAASQTATKATMTEPSAAKPTSSTIDPIFGLSVPKKD